MQLGWTYDLAEHLVLPCDVILEGVVVRGVGVGQVYVLPAELTGGVVDVVEVAGVVGLKVLTVGPVELAVARGRGVAENHIRVEESDPAIAISVYVRDRSELQIQLALS